MLPFSCPSIGNFNWIEPLLKGHLSYKATFSLSQRWPLNTDLTVVSWNPRASYELDKWNPLMSNRKMCLLITPLYRKIDRRCTNQFHKKHYFSLYIEGGWGRTKIYLLLLTLIVDQSIQGKFEDTKGVIRSHTWKKNISRND